MQINLSPRLQCIADYVVPGSRVIDVGTDHAYVPIWLLQNRICSSAAATDIRPGPLKNAAFDAEKYGVSDCLKLILCDGLTGCTPDMADTLILAGMGGETIMGILNTSPWALEQHLILQPQTKKSELRSWLKARGLCVLDAVLAYDAGRIYLVWSVGKGEMRDCAAIDPILMEKRDPLLKPYIEDHFKRLRKQIQGMESSEHSDSELLLSCRRELEELQILYKEVILWQA